MDIVALSKLFPGKVSVDEETLVNVQHDFGQLVRKRPKVVVSVTSSEDVRGIVQFALQEGVSISTRGSAHSQSGQSLSDGGILLDMTGLSTIGLAEPDSVWVEAGVVWRDLVRQTCSLELLPRVLTNNLGVTVGGTLSMGGLGISSHRFGSQADNVLELEVVTGEGHLVRCSPESNEELFNCCRAGLGQFGIITRARVNLRPVAPRVRTYYLLYDDLHTLMRDQERLIGKNRVDYVESWCAPCSQGLRSMGQVKMPFATWFYPMQVSVEYTNEPNDEAILGGLSFYRKVHVEDNLSYDFANRLEPVFQFWKENGTWNLPHPWMEVILPWKTAGAYIEGVLADFPPNLLVGGHVLLWPCRGTTSTAPLLRHPGGEFVMGFGILPAVPRRFLGLALPVLKKASDLCTRVGGKRYLSGWVDYDDAQWQEHFGDRWPQVVAWKKFYDPHGILNPGFIPFPS